MAWIPSTVRSLTVKNCNFALYTVAFTISSIFGATFLATQPSLSVLFGGKNTMKFIKEHVRRHLQSCILVLLLNVTNCLKVLIQTQSNYSSIVACFALPTHSQCSYWFDPFRRLSWRSFLIEERQNGVVFL